MMTTPPATRRADVSLTGSGKRNNLIVFTRSLLRIRPTTRFERSLEMPDSGEVVERPLKCVESAGGLCPDVRSARSLAQELDQRASELVGGLDHRVVAGIVERDERCSRARRQQALDHR